MVNAERPSFVLKDLRGVLDGGPQDHALNVDGEPAVLQEFVVEALERFRPASVAPPASAVGVHVESRTQAGRANRESAKSLVGLPWNCRPWVVPVRQ